jgi:hypothetical protein
VGNAKAAGFGLFRISTQKLSGNLHIARPGYPGEPWQAKRSVSRAIHDADIEATGRTDKQASPGRMKNLRLNPVRESSIKIIIPDKKDYFSKNNGMEFPKVGRGWGENGTRRKKGLTIIRLTPSFYWLPSADSNHGPDG